MRKQYSFFLMAVLGLVAAPCAIAQPSPPPVAFYSEEPWGGSYLGVQTEDVTPERVSQLHLKEERGVEVTTVDQDAPACKAGIREHDVILSINDEKIESVEQLKRVIREIPPGRTISIGISRDGQPMTLKAQLAERDKMADMDHSFNFTMPPINVPAIHIPPINMPEIDVPSIVVMRSPARSGLMVENLTPQLGDFFGVKNGSGVLVRSVEKGSRGEQAGFRAGDVVIKINGSPVNDCSDFTRLLRRGTNNKASVTVLRDRREQTLSLALPETRHTGALSNAFDCDSDEWPACASELKSEVAQFVPEMNIAVMRQEMLRMQPEMKKLQKQMRVQVLDHEKEFKKDMEVMRKQLQEQKKELRKQMKEWARETEL